MNCPNPTARSTKLRIDYFKTDVNTPLKIDLVSQNSRTGYCPPNVSV